ncbi:hypothetical protein P7C73_g6805, partial [Tremellales sp. Uapishka_1]
MAECSTRPYQRTHLSSKPFTFTFSRDPTRPLKSRASYLPGSSSGHSSSESPEKPIPVSSTVRGSPHPSPGPSRVSMPASPDDAFAGIEDWDSDAENKENANENYKGKENENLVEDMDYEAERLQRDAETMRFDIEKEMARARALDEKTRLAGLAELRARRAAKLSRSPQIEQTPSSPPPLGRSSATPNTSHGLPQTPHQENEQCQAPSPLTWTPSPPTQRTLGRRPLPKRLSLEDMTVLKGGQGSALKGKEKEVIVDNSDEEAEESDSEAKEDSDNREAEEGTEKDEEEGEGDPDYDEFDVYDDAGYDEDYDPDIENDDGDFEGELANELEAGALQDMMKGGNDGVDPALIRAQGMDQPDPSLQEADEEVYDAVFERSKEEMTRKRIDVEDQAIEEMQSRKLREAELARKEKEREELLAEQKEAEWLREQEANWELAQMEFDLEIEKAKKREKLEKSKSSPKLHAKGKGKAVVEEEEDYDDAFDDFDYEHLDQIESRSSNPKLDAKNTLIQTSHSDDHLDPPQAKLYLITDLAPELQDFYQNHFRRGADKGDGPGVAEKASS